MSTTNTEVNDNETILVIGGTGKTGRRVAERLAQAGRRIRIGSRRAEVPFDWEKPATWQPALDGATAAYVTFQPDLAMPGSLETILAFFSQAVGSGVRKLVLLTGRREVEAQQAEEALQATDADWTILRASWFFQNFSESFFLEPIIAGELALPVDRVVEPFIDAEDIAEVAVAALTDPQHSRQVYELTGSKALTFAEATEEIARATGRRITFIPVSLEAYRAEMERGGVPQDYIELVIYLFTTVLDGRNAAVADGVQRALGKAPRSFSDYARETAASGIWGSRLE